MSDPDLTISPTADPELIEHTDDHVVDTPPSMRERLARALVMRHLPAMPLTDEARETLIQRDLSQARFDVGAILTELESPSEAAISYGEGYMDMTMPDAFPDRGKSARDREFRTGFVAAIQHIKDGGY